MSQGVGENYAYEIVESASRVNYGQNLDYIHALMGTVSMATGGAKGIKEGNYRIFENFIQTSHAKLNLKTTVTGLSATPDGKWALRATASAPNGGTDSFELTETYDSVIIAAPINSFAASLPKSIAPIVPVEYYHLHVTLLSTTSPFANPAYFGLEPGDTVPNMVLTTALGTRTGGPVPEFNSISYHGRIAEGKDEWVVKIFSTERMEDEWITNVFGNVGWVLRKEVGSIFYSLGN